MNSWTLEEVQKTLEILKKRIIADESYRRFCLADPHSAIRELSGKELPDGLKLGFAENGEAYLIIDESMADLPEGELSDLELELVTGGAYGYADVKTWWQAVSVKRTPVNIDMPTGVAGVRG